MSAFRIGWWRYGITGLAVAFLVWYVGPAALAATLRNSNPSWLVAYLCSYLLVPVLYGLQLLGALRLAGHAAPASAVMPAAIEAWSLGTFTPVRAGDLSLAYFLRGHVPEIDALGAVSVDKFVSLATLAILALLSASVTAVPHGSVLVIGATLTLVTAALLLAVLGWRRAHAPVRGFIRRWFGARAEHGWERMRSFASSPRVLAWCMAMTTARWIYICAGNILVFLAVGESPGFHHIVAATAVGRVISLVPVSIGGIGIKEPVQIVIYGAAGVPPVAVLAVSALGLATGFVVAGVLPHAAGAMQRLVRERG